TPLIGLSSQDDATPPAYQIIYAPLADGISVRAICIGYDFNYTRNGEPITRTMMKDFRLIKRVNTSILAPSRILIGKNVRVYGDLGTRFDEVDSPNGDPLLIRSDFAGIDDDLDEKLDLFFSNLATFDADGDNRLRLGHPIEGGGLPSDDDFDGDGESDGAYADATGDGYVDEFDIFINHFDADGNGRVTLSAALTAGTAAEGLTPEFVNSEGNPLDDDLALLIDGGNPDRNRNGVWGYADINDNGYFDDGDELVDYDANLAVYSDQVLGYRDGFIDKMDRYAKVAGSLAFNVSSSDWVDGQGSWGDKIGGPIIPDDGDPPLMFEAPDHVLPELTADSFTDQETDLHNAANGESFEQQVADQLGISVDELDAYEESQEDGTEQPRYFRLDPDTDGDGLPDNYADAYFEKMPFNSPNYADWYYRPVYENMVFRDVQIPMGTNALFYNCTFVGVTWVRTYQDNDHIHWTLYGRMGFDSALGVPVPASTREIYGDDADEMDGADAYSGLPETAMPPSALLLCAEDPLDKADILESEIATYNPDDYALLPEPLIYEGRRITDTRELSNNIRFHYCLIVGSIVSDKPSQYTHVRNKMQFTGRTRFETTHPDYPDDPAMNPDDIDLEEILKSSMMLPNYSVDVGSFNSPPEQDVTLQGAIIAGVLDIRGNASITGSLLLTFDPNSGEGPLVDHLGNPIGNPASFNASIGYFGPDDGDDESLDPRTLPEVDGEKIVGWDLDGDGLADLGPDETPSADQIADGATAVPWNGYGRVELRFDPTMTMPDGIMLPLQMELQTGTYREGHP
ncbi:MAG: hypothetical protein KDA28_10780, partial [Phycisphaerales bacterium]|nr:hypothetical protein [Phycisphaerales bacterium]